MRRRDVMKSAIGAAAVAANPPGARADGKAQAAGPWRPPAKGGVRMIENQLIPMPDGVDLAVQLWLPEGPEARAWPVVIEYIPYRKRDRYRAYGLYWGRTLAQHGVGYARLETRGSGDSTGLLEDEYLPQQHLDAATAIAWLADQPWCNGAVGMRGVSWGGFSTLQAAALAPPALKAIMPMCASDMRYTDDAHYIGGAFALTGLKWATSMKLVMAGPPDPVISGAAWREAWRKRLDATPAIAARWLSHQTNDAYWRQGSVGLDWSAIRCPVYAVGGLVDPYGDAIPRLLESLTVPRKGLVGPWRHGYPAPASPGPALDWAWEEVRWWRHWLLNEPTGIMDEPMLRVYMPKATAAQTAPGPIPGRWVAERSWPSGVISARRFHLGDGTLSEAAQPSRIARLPAGPVVGLGKVEWVPFAPTELPREQSADDARSLTFDSPPLAADLEILGAPAFRIRLSSDRPVAHLAARLCEVTPEGRSWLIAWGLLNLTHRSGHEPPVALEPGREHDIAVSLNFVAHAFQAGSRLRLSLSQSLWPLVWPAPETATLSVDLGEARLDLPVRPAPGAEASMPIAPAPPAPSDPADWPTMEITETAEAIRVVETWPTSTATVADIGETVSGSGPNIVLSIRPGDPLSCAWRAEQSARYSRPGWDVAISASVSITCDASVFVVAERLTASLDGDTVADVEHTARIPRRLA